jgi:hypothetical protein
VFSNNKTPIISNTGPVPLFGIAAHNGYVKAENKNKTPHTIVDSPVRAPANMAGADSALRSTGPAPKKDPIEFSFIVFFIFKLGQ